jgi:hypothetical protein
MALSLTAPWRQNPITLGVCVVEQRRLMGITLSKSRAGLPVWGTGRYAGFRDATVREDRG